MQGPCETPRIVISVQAHCCSGNPGQASSLVTPLVCPWRTQAEHSSVIHVAVLRIAELRSSRSREGTKARSAAGPPAVALVPEQWAQTGTQIDRLSGQRLAPV
jgi:hypothetical protein